MYNNTHTHTLNSWTLQACTVRHMKQKTIFFDSVFVSLFWVKVSHSMHIALLLGTWYLVYMCMDRWSNRRQILLFKLYSRTHFNGLAFLFYFDFHTCASVSVEHGFYNDAQRALGRMHLLLVPVQGKFQAFEIHTFYSSSHNTENEHFYSPLALTVLGIDVCSMLD